MEKTTEKKKPWGDRRAPKGARKGAKEHEVENLGRKKEAEKKRAWGGKGGKLKKEARGGKSKAGSKNDKNIVKISQKKK